MLSQVIENAYNSCCPIKRKTLSYKNKQKPWITQNILINIKKRQKYYLLFKARKISKLFYVNFWNKVTFEIRQAKVTYYETKFNEFKSNTKKTWQLINNIIKPNSCRKNITDILHKDVHYTTDDGIAGAFNDFFANIGKNISDSFNLNAANHNYQQYLVRGNFVNSFFFTPVVSADVNNIIISLKK